MWKFLIVVLFCSQCIQANREELEKILEEVKSLCRGEKGTCMYSLNNIIVEVKVIDSSADSLKEDGLQELFDCVSLNEVINLIQSQVEFDEIYFKIKYEIAHAKLLLRNHNLDLLDLQKSITNCLSKCDKEGCQDCFNKVQLRLKLIEENCFKDIEAFSNTKTICMEKNTQLTKKLEDLQDKFCEEY